MQEITAPNVVTKDENWAHSLAKRIESEAITMSKDVSVLLIDMFGEEHIHKILSIKDECGKSITETIVMQALKRCVTGNDQFFVCFHIFKGIQQIVDTLFRNQPAQKENVRPPLKAIGFCDFRRGLYFGL